MPATCYGVHGPPGGRLNTLWEAVEDVVEMGFKWALRGAERTWPATARTDPAFSQRNDPAGISLRRSEGRSFDR